MKKHVNYIGLFIAMLMIFVLSGCLNPKNIQSEVGETTTGTATEEKNDTEKTENIYSSVSEIKKAGVKFDDVKDATTAEEFKTKVDAECRYDWLTYVFFIDADGEECYALFESDLQTVKKVVKLGLKSDFRPTKEAAEGIAAGMPIEEIVEVLGIPFASRTSGVLSAAWETDDGSIVEICFESGENPVSK